MDRKGADLALLLLGGFRRLADEASAELSRRGYDDVRPSHDFALRAIAAGAANTSELARRLSVSKQAAAKTVALMQERGFVARADDPRDARRKLLQVTERGFDMLRQAEAIFDALRSRWEAEVGPDDLRSLEANLTTLVGGAFMRMDAPGWIAEDLEGSGR